MNNITLILATVGRVDTLHDFFRSLSDQDAQLRIRVILVDQNTDDRLREIYETYSELVEIIWIGSRKGLSKARNKGLVFLHGSSVVGFPDDDCIYPPNFLSHLVEVFDKLQVDFVTVNQFSVDGETDTRPPSGNMFVTRYNVWRACGSIRTFYLSSAIRAVGGFDESLGLGAGTPWKGGEDIDYPIRALAKGLNGWFQDSLHVVHEASRSSQAPGAMDRIFGYNASMGRIWRQHHYPLWWFTYQCCRPVGGMFMALTKLDWSEVTRQVMSLSGRLNGWLASGRANDNHHS